VVFEKYAKYYDLLYQDKDYPAESQYISSLIDKYHPETKKPSNLDQVQENMGGC
jgi:hypothetical protein